MGEIVFVQITSVTTNIDGLGQIYRDKIIFSLPHVFAEQLKLVKWHGYFCKVAIYVMQIFATLFENEKKVCV